MKLVKFTDGTYGIRRRTLFNLFFPEYKDLSGKYWWGKHQEYYLSSCRDADYDKVKKLFDAMTDSGSTVEAKTYFGIKL